MPRSVPQSGDRVVCSESFHGKGSLPCKSFAFWDGFTLGWYGKSQSCRVTRYLLDTAVCEPLVRGQGPLLWVVEGWPWPVSYGAHTAIDHCHGGPRPPTECLSGPLVRTLPRTLKRDAPLFLSLPCMHARKSNHGGQPRRTLGPTHTSSTRVRALSAAG